MNRTNKALPENRNGELLRTKLTPPRLHEPLIERPALYERLDEGVERRVILLSAPAGSGKTTLVRTWLESREGCARIPPLAWVALDANENDPLRFWRYLLTACQSFQSAPGEQSLAVLRRVQQPLETTLTIFINELTRMDGRGILVLEDYHTINSARVHETLTFLLDYMPENVCVVLITRADPPLPLARWRVQGNLYELRASDLRFSLQETRTFLQQACACPLAPAMLKQLDERIEGWPAGLRLLALALQGHREAHEIENLLATFSGSHQHIFTYLTADVLNALPLPQQHFLLQTSLLTRLSGSLCNALTGRQDGAQMLAHLAQANLFLYPLDGGGEWYRYHALFAEAMQHEARLRLGTDEWHALYHRASLWYEEHGSQVEAIAAAIAGRAFARAAILMEKIVTPQVFQNEYCAITRYIEQLPEEELQVHPDLCIVYASGILYLADRRSPATPALMERPLRMAERFWQAEGNLRGLGEIEALRASALWWQGDFTRAFTRSRQALELLPDDELLWRGTCLITLGVAEMFAGQPVRAQEVLMQARLTNEAAGNYFAVRATQFLLCLLYLQRGEPRLAAQIYQQLFGDAEAAQDLTDVGAACWGLGVLAYEWNNRETAREAIMQALDVARRLADDDSLVRASLVQARLQQLAGQNEQAQSDLTALTAQVQRWPYLLYEIHACRALLALASGDLLTARQQLDACAQYSEESNFVQQEALARLRARLLIVQGQTGEALKLLQTWREETQERGFIRSLLEILVLQALAYHAHKEPARARQALLQALTLARPQGYQRLFLDEGPAIGELLRTLLPDIHEEHLLTWTRALLQTWINEQTTSTDGEGQPSTDDPWLSEPLSPQERRVLRLLTAGHSNPEIASELVVSINTIKTQVQSIYYKLGVNSRQEAREAAHRFHLV